MCSSDLAVEIAEWKPLAENFKRLCKQQKLSIDMTLTAPGCGMGATIAGDAQQKILMLPSVEDASVEIVWDPPWHQSMITPEGRRLLGIE